jgi:methylase of polypeptide subunit release factors
MGVAAEKPIPPVSGTPMPESLAGVVQSFNYTPWGECNGVLLKLEGKLVQEIGTSNGISAIWFGLALRKTGGRLITHEIDPDAAALARKNFAIAGVGELVTIVEGDAHKTVSGLKGPIDLAFIDAGK